MLPSCILPFAYLALLSLSPLQAAPPSAAAQASAAQLAQAKGLMQAGQFDAARTAYEAALAAVPSSAEAQEGEVAASEKLALAARAQHDPDTALADLLRAQRFAPDNRRLMYDLGVLEDEMHLLHDADAVLTRLSAMQPTDARTLYAVARVKTDLGQLAPAEQAMRAYLQQNPEDATAHYGLGRIFQLGQHPAEARAEFERSIALQPQQTESYFQLGQIALDGGQYEDAIAQFAMTLKGNPHHGGALAGTGIAYFREKKYAEAATFLKRAVADAPDYQPGHYYLGLTLARLGQKDDSARELAQAAKMADEQNQKDSQRLRLQTPQ